MAFGKRHGMLIGAIAIVALLMLVRWTAMARRAADMAELECLQLYAHAATAAETLLADTTHPTQQPRDSGRRVTCADLR